MHLDGSAVEGSHLDFEVNDLLLLESLEYPCEHTILRPRSHARVNGVPVTECRWEPTPLGSVFSNVEDGIEHIQRLIFQGATWFGEAMRNAQCVRSGLGLIPSKPIAHINHLGDFYLNRP